MAAPPKLDIEDYKSIVKSIPDLILVMDVNFDIVAVSDAYATATQIKREEVLGRNIFDVFPENPEENKPTGIKNLRDSLSIALQEKIVDSMAVQKYDIRNAQNKFLERYWSPVNSPVLDKEGNVKFIVHRVEDVTEYIKLAKDESDLKTEKGRMDAVEILRRAQLLQDTNKKLRLLNDALAESKQEILKRTQDLETSEKRMRLILEASKEFGIIMLDKEGYITTWSKGAENVHGYQEKEVIGKHFSLFYPPEATQNPQIELNIAKETGRYEEENFRLRKNGERFWANIVIAPIYDSDEKLLGFAKITRDLTSRKKIETLRNDFISVVSHELRTPLTSIHGSLSLILGGAAGSFPDKVKKLLDIADSNCNRLVRLVNDILDIQKIEAGKMVFDCKPVVLADVVKKAIDENRMYAEKYAVSLRFDSIIPRLKINVDVDRLLQVLANLISNAVKFSPKDHEVIISMEQVEKQVRVKITDTGSGVPVEFQKKIFEKFSQADSSTARKGSGTGLGLTITKAIVEKMGGTLDFKSKENLGTVFFFDFPIWEDPVKTQQAAPNGFRILVCEDDISQANFLKVNLEIAGYKADIANNAAQVKQLLALKKYAVLCLDLILPDEDGITLIREIRNSENNPKIPIIVVSIIARDGKNLMNGDALEVVDWLDKPVDMNRLMESFDIIKNQDRKTISNVLHIEDDVEMQNLVRTLLEDSADVSSVATLREAKEIIDTQTFDLAILDLILPDGNGVNLLALLAKHKIPVIVLARQELDHQYSEFVHAALVKSEISPEQLLARIEKLLRSR